MRKSVLLLATSAILASVVTLSLIQVFPGSRRGPETALALSSGASEAWPAVKPLVSDEEDTLPTAQTSPQSDAGMFSAPLVPIPTPSEFASIPPTKVYWHHDQWQKLHSQIEREPIDAAWASPMEVVLKNAFSESQEITRHGTPTINCRTTMCQVQMMAYGAPDVDEGEWSTYFGFVIRSLRSDFDIADFSVAQATGGTAMILHLTRRQAPTPN